MPNVPWLIFDADNTLWNIEELYDAAREEFCKYTIAALNESAANTGKQVTLELVSTCQQQRDIQLYETYGYSAARFARSFEDTLLFLFPQVPSRHILHVRRIATNVFEQKPTPTAGLEELLSGLKDSFKFGIVTAGEAWVQERRLQQFHLRSSFAAVELVERKTADTFRNFCRAHQVDPHTSWVIGDSVKSDIIPAVEAGLRPIHLKAPNWAIESGALPAGVPSISSLRDVVSIVAGA